MKSSTVLKADRNPTRSETVATEHSMRSWDATELFYRAWHPGYPRKRALILFHGGHEHSGRFDDLVNRLRLDDISVFAWDARGHGRSPGRRGYANHFHDLVKDADAFVRHIGDTHGIAVQDMLVLGHSVGSVIISTWLHDYAPPVRGAVLGSPAFNVKLYVPFALPVLKLWQKLQPGACVNSYVKPGMLTHDKDEAEARRNDPLIASPIAVRVLTSLFDTAQRVIENARRIHTPVLLLCAEKDRVVHRSVQQRFFDNLGAQDKELVTYPDFYHEIFHEKDRAQPIEKTRRFVRRLFNDRRAYPFKPFLPADSDKTFRALQTPLPWSRPGKYYYAVTRFLLGTVGRLSQGIRIGWDAGFDSGRTLDHVYRNQARGISPLGRLIDRAFLDAVGWQGIRTRGRNLTEMLTRVIKNKRWSRRSVHVLDIASGPARYLLETVQRFGENELSATCRDWDERGLNEGRQLARTMNINSVSFEKGDAFDRDSLATIESRPDIVVVSGLYELFSDNGRIQRSLNGIHAIMNEEGYLLYTNQPCHPQQELIARTLDNRDGEPWVMRLRSQAEMNQLVREAGFEPMETRMDDHGIFSVTIARRRGA